MGRAYRASPTLISSFCTKLSTNFHTFWSSFSAHHTRPQSRLLVIERRRKTHERASWRLNGWYRWIGG